MMQQYFEKYRQSIIGLDYKFKSPFGEQDYTYADWTAMGRPSSFVSEKN